MREKAASSSRSSLTGSDTIRISGRSSGPGSAALGGAGGGAAHPATTSIADRTRVRRVMAFSFSLVLRGRGRRLNRKHDSESPAAVPAAGIVVLAVGRPASPRRVVVGSAAPDALRPGRGEGDGDRAGPLVRAGIVKVGAPFSDVPMHIVETEGIGLERSDVHHRAPVGAVSRTSIADAAVDVGVAGSQSVAGAERGHGSPATGIFPLHLGRQADLSAQATGRAFAKLLRIEGGHALDRMTRTAELAGILSHDGFVLFLGHLVAPHIKGRRQQHLSDGPLVRIASTLV